MLRPKGSGRPVTNCPVLLLWSITGLPGAEPSLAQDMRPVGLTLGGAGDWRLTRGHHHGLWEMNLQEQMRHLSPTEPGLCKHEPVALLL